MALDAIENEDAWCKKLEDYLFREIPNSIQSRGVGLGYHFLAARYRGMVAQMAFRTILGRTRTAIVACCM
jgi:hypothetical protein